MELSKEKTDKIIQQYLKQREKAKPYYKQYQKDNKEKINSCNIEQYYKNKEKFFFKRKNTTSEKKEKKQN